MVGSWGLRKGCDLIVDAIKQTDYKFLHVGSIGDYPFPKDDPQFTHIDAIDQKQLVKYYNKAKVFLLPSREEGLALVQAQAIACNLPIIGSKDSGVEDLLQIVDDPYFITILKDYSVAAVVEGINSALKKCEELGTQQYAGDLKKNLSWDAYGKRYSDNIKIIVGIK